MQESYQNERKKKWQLLKKVKTLTDHLTIQELFTEHWEEPLLEILYKKHLLKKLGNTQLTKSSPAKGGEDGRQSTEAFCKLHRNHLPAPKTGSCR